MTQRESDRWVTPRVVVAMLFAGTVVVLAFLAAVTYLQARGIDPDPMLRLMGEISTAVGVGGTFILQLVTRRTSTKVEKHTGRDVPERIEELSRNTKDLADATWEILHEIPRRPDAAPDPYPLTRPAPGYGATPPADGR